MTHTARSHIEPPILFRRLRHLTAGMLLISRHLHERSLNVPSISISAIMRVISGLLS